MRRILHTLLSLLVLEAVAEGVILCQKKPKSESEGVAYYPSEYNSHRRGFHKQHSLTDEDASVRAELEYESRRELSEGEVRAALIMDDAAALRASDWDGDRLMRSDYSALTDLLEADPNGAEVWRKNLYQAADEADEADRRSADSDLLMDRFLREEQDAGFSE